MEEEDTTVVVAVSVTGAAVAGTGLCTKATDRRVAPKIADQVQPEHEHEPEEGASFLAGAVSQLYHFLFHLLF